jgi:hypothetical protein
MAFEFLCRNFFTTPNTHFTDVIFPPSKSKLTAESKILRARSLLAYFPDNLSGCRKAIKPGFFNAFLSITFIIRKSNFIGKKHSMAYPGVCNLTLWEPLRGQRAKQDKYPINDGFPRNSQTRRKARIAQTLLIIITHPSSCPPALQLHQGYDQYPLVECKSEPTKCSWCCGSCFFLSVSFVAVQCTPSAMLRSTTMMFR